MYMICADYRQAALDKLKLPFYSFEMKYLTKLFLFFCVSAMLNAQELVGEIFDSSQAASGSPRILILPVQAETSNESNRITALLYRKESTLGSHYVLPYRKLLDEALSTAQLQPDDYAGLHTFAEGLGAQFILWSKVGRTQEGELVFILELIETGSGHIVGGAYQSLPSNVYNRYSEEVGPLLSALILEDVEKLLPDMVAAMVAMAAQSAKTNERFAVRTIEGAARDELADEADIFRHILLIETAKAKIYLVDPGKDIQINYEAQVEIRISREERTFEIWYVQDDGVEIRLVSDVNAVIGFDGGIAQVIGFDGGIDQMISLIQEKIEEQRQEAVVQETVVQPPELPLPAVSPDPDFLFYTSLRYGVYTPFDTPNNDFFVDMPVSKGGFLGDGIEIGAAFTWQVLKTVGLSVEAVYIEDALTLKQPNNESVTIRSQLLQIPLLLRFDFRTERFLFGFFSGVYFTPVTLLGGNKITIEDGAFSGYNDSVAHYGVTPAGLIFGGSFGIRLGRFTIFTDLRYQMDLQERGLSAGGFKSASGSTHDVLLYTRNKLSYSLGFEMGLWDKNQKKIEEQEASQRQTAQPAKLVEQRQETVQPTELPPPAVSPNPDSLFYISLRYGVYTPFDTLNNDFFVDMPVSKGGFLGDGIEIGAAFTWQVLKTVGLSVETVYIEDALTLKQQNNESVTIRSQLLQIPLLLRFDFRTERFLFGFFSGVYFTPVTLLGGNKITIEDGAFSGYNDSVAHYGVTPAGLIFGGSFGIRLGRFTIFTDLRYQMDLQERGLSAGGFKSASGSTHDVLLYTRNKLSYSLGFQIGLWDKK
ncbi:porin family protein [Breznakiellaceae bacterium SP9]